jgi:hypothetical protein
MAKTLHSNNITFIDLTDTKKMEVHIASNLPTTQIYDVNTGNHSPNWSNTPLKLIPTVFADGIDITNSLTDSAVTWYRQIGDGQRTLVSNIKTLTISSNELTHPDFGQAAGVISYICFVQYNNNDAETQITFARVDTGKNGTNGNSAPVVKAQYSEDGSTGWTATLDASTHKYIRLSYDNGTTWTSAIKIAGKDGTSVSIKGTATSKSAVSDTSYYTLVYNSTTITGAAVGDAYLLDGNLYVCVDSRDGNDYFMDVGHIQGPQGVKGDSYYLFIRYADNISGSGISASPDGKSYIGFYRSSVNQVPTDVSAATWNWAKFVGEDAKSITLTGSAQAFKINKSNVVSPATIQVTAQVENTTISSNGWTYSVDGGQTFTTTVPTGVSRSGNVVTLTGASITSNSIAIKATDGSHSDVFTVYKVSDGSDGKPGDEGAPAYTAFLTNESIAFVANSSGQIPDETTIHCNVVVYRGTEKVLPILGAITGLPTGMTITSNPSTTEINELQLTIKVESKATLDSSQSTYGSINIPIVNPIGVNLKLSWSKINSGAKGDKGDMGVGIKSTTVDYGVSDSASVKPTTWQQDIPVVAEGRYLWTRTITDYTDTSKADTVTYVYTKQGIKGDTGTSGSSVTVKSIKYQSGASATTAPTGTWSDGVVAVAEGNYLWTQTTFSDNKVAYGVAKQGQKGDKGDQGVQGPKGNDGQQYYTWVKYADTPTSGMSNDPDGKTYIGLAYNKTTATESTTYSDYAWSLIRGATGAVGPKGDDGQQYYTWIKYADSASGANMSDLPDGKLYIGLAYNKTTSMESNLASDYTWALFKGDKGDKGDTGRGISKITEYYLATASSSEVTTTTSGWTTTIQSIDTAKKYLWNYEAVTYTDGTTIPTTPVIIGVFGNTGATGKGISSVVERYLATASSSGVTTLTTGWTPEVQTLTSTKKYLWNYEIITYTDGTTSTINPVIIGVYGDKGDVGRGVTSIVEQYYQSTSATSQTGGSWSATVPTWTDGKYIWTRSVITYTDSTTSTTSPICITGQKGGTGVGVSSVDVWYYQSTSATALSGGSWSTIAPTWSDGKYIWTKTITTYTNSTTDETTAVCITGQKGPKGNDAYTVMLTNESHIFAGDVSNAIAGSTTTQVLAYNGSTAQTVTIVSVNGKTAATADTDTGIAGLKFKCSALSGTSPTITFTCTTSFVSKSGTIPIVLSVGGVSFTKMFTYSIAFKGTAGNPGSPGTPASLVDITPSALYFKSTTGKDGTFTPDYIYLYPRFQTVTFSGWQYSINGGTTWVAASGANGLSIGTYNSVANTLRIAKTSTLYTDTVTSISFKCVSSNSSVYDTVSIAKIYDVVDLQIGGTNLVALNDCGTYAGGKVSIGKFTNITSDKYSFTTTDKPSDLIGFIGKNLEPGKIITISGKTDLTNMTNYYSFYNNDGTMIGVQTNKTVSVLNGSFNFQLTVPTGATTIHIGLGLYPYVSNYTIANVKIEHGNKATDWSPAPEDLKSTTFQLYAPKGYLITNDVPTVTLETFAYDGSQPITGATFAWYSWNGEAWVTISGATGTLLTLNKSSVLKSNVYKCVMTYKEKTYEATATVEDKTDIYDCLINVTAKYSPTNKIYWVLYTTVFSEEGERDKLLGPVDIVAPENPATGAYWYKIDETNYTATLMKYSGTAWTATTDKQEFMYDWFLFNDTTDIVSLGVQSKVKIVTSNDFSRVCSVQCNVSDSTLVPMTHNNQMLTDPSDPVVSSTAPINPINGQLWIKTDTNGVYTLLVWDASLGQWIVSEADSQVKVHINKPTSYAVGDVWVVGSDYEPTAYVNGVAQTTKHLAGTMLKAQYSSQTYKDSDWVEALNYKKEIDELKEGLNVYNQFFTFDDTGMTMRAKNLNGKISEFSTKLTNNELGFYQGENKVAYINNNQLNISKAEITNGMIIGGAAPVLEIGNFAIIQESNGSLSIGLKS